MLHGEQDNSWRNKTPIQLYLSAVNLFRDRVGRNKGRSSCENLFFNRTTEQLGHASVGSLNSEGMRETLITESQDGIRRCPC